ncbi:MAG: hypothetical protein AAF125_26300, partial [Chloroflexota bacterium]
MSSASPPQPTRSLATQVLWRVGILSAITVVLAIVVLFNGTARSLSLIRVQLLRDLAELSHDLDLELTRIESELLAVGHTIAMDTSTEPILRDFLDRHETVFTIQLLDLDGNIISQRQRMDRMDLAPITDQPWLIADTPYWSRVSDEMYGFPFIDLAVPVTNVAANRVNERVGTLMVSIDL